MRFEFFTMGGSQLWEDVFFYQKWRIQRNYRTKEYRLLDPWDIQRQSGGFENCRRAFLDYIEIYEISRQRGHMVIMLHGLGDSKNIFKPLWRAVLKEGMMAAAINYPSTRKRIDSHVRQLDFLLNHLEDVQEVSFVTKGVGGIVLRKLMALESPWQTKLKIRRIVQVCPPNQGSKLFAKLEKYSFFQMVARPDFERSFAEQHDFHSKLSQRNRVWHHCNGLSGQESDQHAFGIVKKISADAGRIRFGGCKGGYSCQQRQLQRL